LINRHLIGKDNSSFEAKGLRLYFDFLEVIDKSWLDGSDEVFNRPIALFSKYLKSSFEKGEIAGTVAVNYFGSVARFYKFHLEKGQVFNGTPISFVKRKLEINTNSLVNHISRYAIEINTVDCAPNIPSNSKSSELKPLSKEHIQLLFSTLKEKSTREFFLICFIAQATGLRAGEIADLKLEQFSKYDDENIFNLYVGPQVGHQTKGNQNGVIKVNKTVMNIIQEHITSSDYIKRLGRFNGEKPFLFLNRKGNQYTQEIISVMFNQLMNNHIKPIDNKFDYKFHDLRATFGVSIMKACLDAKMSRTDSLAYTQNQMRHKNIETTLHYLEYWTHSVVNEKKSQMQENLLNGLFTDIGSFNG
jgi:integrase